MTAYRALGLGALDSDPALDPAARLPGCGRSSARSSAGATAGSRSASACRVPAAARRDVGRRRRSIEQFGDAIGCWAVTEPDHGSDTLTFSEKPFRDTTLRPNCVAEIHDDEVVINGQKSAWVSNGSIATVATLFCTIDGDEGFKGGGVAVVDLTLPGVTKGKPLDKLGQRALNQGEIFFDDVRVPRRVHGRRPRATATPVVEIDPRRGERRAWAPRSSASRAPPTSTRSTYAKERVRAACRSSSTRA